MSYIIPGNARVEKFNFPNKMQVCIDYGIIWEGNYEPFFERYSGSLRRSQVLDFDGNIVTEIIEDNPDEMNYDERQKILNAGQILGDEFERIIHFPNGYTAKIEYWVTPAKRDKNFGRYDAKYQKKILLDENSNVISEVMDYNPHYMDSNVEVIHVNSDEVDFD